MSEVRRCTFPRCNRKHTTGGYCQTHYKQKRRGEDLRPIRPLRPPDSDPTKWFWTLVDRSGNCWEWKGGKSHQGYGNYRVKGIKHYAHRYAYEAVRGPIPDGLHIDHACRNTGCVNPAHLRLATAKQNMENLSATGNRRNTSGFRGVSYVKNKGYWVARATHNGEEHWGGAFATAEEAAQAVQDLRAKLFTHSQN